jgi:hypothetical protein
MLDNMSAWDQVTQSYGQVGWVELPGNDPAHNNYQRFYFMQARDSNGTLIVNSLWREGTQPDIATQHVYNALFDPTSGQITYQIDSVNKEIGTPLNWAPSQAFISGETHNTGEQMPGDVTRPANFLNAGWVPAGTTNWQAFNGDGSAIQYTYANTGVPPIAGDPPYYGHQPAPGTTNGYQIWDYACPRHDMAFNSNTQTLWTDQSAGGTTTGQGFSGSTGPSLASLGGGAYVVAFQGADGFLHTYLTSSNTYAQLPFLMAPGTSPSVAPLAGGGYEIAFQSNTGLLYTYSSITGGTNLGQSMKARTNPVIATSPSGGVELAYQSFGGFLYLYANGAPSPTPYGMLAGTSPGLALGGSGYEAVFQSNTQKLYTYSGGVGVNTNQGMVAGSSPAITVTSAGTYEVAFAAAAGTLFTYAGAPSDTLQGIAVGTSPSIGAFSGGGFIMAFHARTGELRSYSSAGLVYISGGMLDGSSPGIASS